MNRTRKLLALLVVISLASFDTGSRDVTLANAISSNGGGYEEQLSLEVTPQSGDVSLTFTFTGMTGPFDPQDLLNNSLVGRVTISGWRMPTFDEASVFVGLAGINVLKGKPIADAIVAEFERVSGLTIPYFGNMTSTGPGGDEYPAYSYRIIGQFPIQRFRDIFLEHKPSEGLGTILSPSLFSNYLIMSFDLVRKGNLLEWTIVAQIHYPKYFETRIDGEYAIGLRDLVGYGSKLIQVSPRSSKSTLRILLYQADKEHKIIPLDALPLAMTERREVSPIRQGVTTLSFERTISAGERIDDLSIRFRIVSPYYIDPTTIATVSIVVGMAILGLAVFIVRKRRSHRVQQVWNE